MNIHHICIQTNTYEESINFYTSVLGFKMHSETKNFNGRSYNTWLDLNGFMIELQTGKGDKALGKFHKETEAIVHFCLYSDTFLIDYNRIKSLNACDFVKKKDSDIYNVKGNKLFKLIAPEGTIVEVRTSLEP